MRTVGPTPLRRLVIAAQGFATRARRGTTAELESAIGGLSAVQLDSISTVERSHRIALAGRVGAYDEKAVTRLLRSGRVIEYWAHEACLMPALDWPLLRWRMHRYRVHPWFGDIMGNNPGLAEQVLETVREQGPLGSRDFEGQGRGGMWNWKPAKQMLEALFSAGELAIAGRVNGFQRAYDLPERVLPPEVLAAPVPTEDEAIGELIVKAVEARGALTLSGIAEHWRLRGGMARVRPMVDSLLAAGRIEQVRVEDGGADVFVPAGTELDAPAPTAAVLLSPFDNLLWDRDFARRVLGFDHLIEVYKPQPQRVYGYYVLPLLWRDRIVGRADLKSDRGAGELQVRAFHRETGVRASASLDDALDRALDRLRRTAGLERVRR
jgi:uncharacterized protein YcaQ